jgi:mRNA-degrading endonuclease RelE of RelBE toxin-antitoxin system
VSLRIVWRSPARRELRRLDPPDQQRIIAAVERFSQTGEGDIQRLTAISPPQHRLRVGPWRVRLALNREAQALEILHVLPRGKAYR